MFRLHDRQFNEFFTAKQNHSQETLRHLNIQYHRVIFYKIPLTDGQTLNLKIREFRSHILIAHIKVYLLLDFGQDEGYDSRENAKKMLFFHIFVTNFETVSDAVT